LDGRDLVIINRHGGLADTDDLEDTRGDEHGQTIARVEPAKEVSGEQRDLQLLYAV
jgi:hypothetical protein